MKDLSHLNRFCKEGGIHDGGGLYFIPVSKTRVAKVIASWGMGWEHVSVSFTDRCPRWDELCVIKDMFWDDEECVVQYHPPKSRYISVHPYCLHLWRPTEAEIPQPPLICV